MALILVVAGLVVAGGALPAAAEPSREPPRVLAARTGVHGVQTRFVLELSDHAVFSVDPQAAPDRIVLELAEVESRRFETAVTGAGAIRRYRFERGEGRAGRFILETAGAVKLHSMFEMAPAEGHGVRLVLDLDPVTRSAPALTPVVQTAPSRPPSASALTLPARPFPSLSASAAPSPSLPSSPSPASGRTVPPLAVGASVEAVRSGRPATPVAMRMAEHPDKTRFVLELSAPVAYRVEAAAEPYRLLVHLPGVNADEAGGRRRGEGVLRGASLVPEDAGAVAVLETTGPVRLKSAFAMAPGEGHQTRLVLDLVPTDAASFVVTEPAPAVSAAPPMAAAPFTPPPLAADVAPPPPPAPPKTMAEVIPPPPARQPPPPAEPLPVALGAPVPASGRGSGAEDDQAGRPEAAPSLPAPAVLTARIGAHSDKTRFVLEVSEPVTFEADAASEPGRVLVRLPRLRGPDDQPFQQSARPGQGLIRSYRIEAMAEGGSRAVLETTGPARVLNAFLMAPSEGYRSRLVLDLAAGAGAAMAAAPPEPVPPSALAPTQALMRVPSLASVLAASPTAAIRGGADGRSGSRSASAPSSASVSTPASGVPTAAAGGEVMTDVGGAGPLRAGRASTQLAMLPAAPQLQAQAPGKRRPDSALAARPAVTTTVPAFDHAPSVHANRLLEEALSRAFGSNPALGSARANLRAVDEGVNQARAQARPSAALTGSAGSGWSKGGISETAAPSAIASSLPDKWVRTNPRTVGVSVTQPIYKGGQISSGISQARNTLQAQKESLRDSEQNVLLQAASAYLDVAQDQSLLELQTDFEAFQKRDLQALRDRFQAGEVNQTDVNLQEAQLASASAARMSAEGTLEADRANYIKLVGTPPGRLALPKLSYPLPASLDEAVDLAETGNPKVAVAKFTEAASRDAVDVTDSALLPSLSLTANMTHNIDSQTPKDFNSAASIKANLTIPLDNGSNLAKSRAARQSANAARINIEQATRTAREAVTTAWRRLMTARSNVTFYETAVKANELAAKGIRQQIAIGSSTIIDLLNTEQALLNARASLIRAHHDEAVATFAILSGTGQLSAQTLGFTPLVSDEDQDRNYSP